MPPFLSPWQRVERLSTPLQGDHQKANLGGVVAAIGNQ